MLTRQQSLVCLAIHASSNSSPSDVTIPPSHDRKTLARPRQVILMMKKCAKNL
ncbi:unnamed protein product [Brugia timori]|uniref:Uncharacterized protein n=1 Tax=Brugia timori TaxID=42155 RepID=A0A3P7W382_9BILA|nr:unnamed protein product [Brugia timori]